MPRYTAIARLPACHKLTYDVVAIAQSANIHMGRGFVHELPAAYVLAAAQLCVCLAKQQRAVYLSRSRGVEQPSAVYDYPCAVFNMFPSLPPL